MRESVLFGVLCGIWGCDPGAVPLDPAELYGEAAGCVAAADAELARCLEGGDEAVCLADYGDAHRMCVAPTPAEACRQRLDAWRSTCWTQGWSSEACGLVVLGESERCRLGPWDAVTPGCADEVDAARRLCGWSGLGGAACRAVSMQADAACAARGGPVDGADCEAVGEAMGGACAAAGFEEPICALQASEAALVCDRAPCVAPAEAARADCVAEGGAPHACDRVARDEMTACADARQPADAPTRPVVERAELTLDRGHWCSVFVGAAMRACHARGGDPEGCARMNQFDAKRCRGQEQMTWWDPCFAEAERAWAMCFGVGGTIEVCPGVRATALTLCTLRGGPAEGCAGRGEAVGQACIGAFDPAVCAGAADAEVNWCAAPTCDGAQQMAVLACVIEGGDEGVCAREGDRVAGDCR